jgi:hypothetical protein
LSLYPLDAKLLVCSLKVPVPVQFLKKTALLINPDFNMNEPISNHCYYIEYMVPVRLRAAEHLDSDLLSLLADFFSKLNYASHQGPGIDVTE